jgi:FkbM family methyltransferase
MSLQTTLAHAATRLIAPLQERLGQRSVWWKLGLFPLQSRVSIQQVSVGGRTVQLQVPPGEADRQQWEIHHLHVDDPYQLRSIRTPVRTVVDIGANIGFFSILARANFPQAIIHCYEPNPALLPITRANTEALSIQLHAEGVGARAMTGAMQCDGATLEGSLVPAADGEPGIAIVPLATVLQRIGGSLDLLKMDCEGAEWDILRDAASLQKVRMIAMEYHLDGGAERTLLALLHQLKQAGFRIEALREAANPLVGQLFAVRTQ